MSTVLGLLLSSAFRSLSPPLPPAEARPVVRPAKRRSPVAARSTGNQSAGPAGTSPASSLDWDKLSVEEIDEWHEQGGPKTPLLDTVNFPVHLKNFNTDQLKQVCRCGMRAGDRLSHMRSPACRVEAIARRSCTVKQQNRVCSILVAAAGVRHCTSLRKS